MIFNFIVCPKCGAKKIVESIVIGTPCSSCKIFLCSDDTDNIKEVEIERAKHADTFSKGFDDFREHLKHEKERWEKENCFVAFKKVSIPDKKLLEMIE
jgi:hypothetical protein